MEMAESLQITGHDVCVLASMEIVERLLITGNEEWVFATVKMHYSL